MLFTSPYLPLALSGTVSRYGLIGACVCVEVDRRGVGPAVGCDPAWKIQYLLATLALQLCAHPTDGNLIPGYWPQTSHPFLSVPISEWQTQPRIGLILRGDGSQNGLSLPSGMKAAEGSFCRSWFNLSALPFLQLTQPEYLLSCCIVWLAVPRQDVSVSATDLMSERSHGPDCDGIFYVTATQAVFLKWKQTH